MSALVPQSQSSEALRWIIRHRLKILLLFIGVCAPLVLFGKFGDEVLENERFAFDLPIQLFVHGHTSPALDRAMLLISAIGSARITVPLDLLIAGFLLWRRRHRHAAFWLLAVGGAGALNAVAKQAFSRERPTLWISPAPETTFSFPSGHAMHSAAIASGLVMLLWHTRWRIPGLIAGGVSVFSVGLSRIYLGVHYPSDVLAAWAASIGWVVGLGIALRVVGVPPTASNHSST
jgi:membrane-associated phospholipid phosphatase